MFTIAAGAAAIDVAGGNNGTWAGTPSGASGFYSASAPHLAHAGEFNGTDNYITAPLTGLPIGSAARTMCGWVKTSSTGRQNFFGYGNPGAGSAFDISLGISGPGILYFVGYADDISGGSYIADGAWHHLAVTYDGSVVRLYFDAVADASAAKSLNTGVASALFHIGEQSYVDGSDWRRGASQISDVRIYNTALTASDLAAVMAEVPPTISGGNALFFGR